MKPPQQRSVAGHNPAEDHPQNPEEVYKQNKLCQHFEESHSPSDLLSPAEMLPHSLQVRAYERQVLLLRAAR